MEIRVGQERDSLGVWELLGAAIFFLNVVLEGLCVGVFERVSERREIHKKMREHTSVLSFLLIYIYIYILSFIYFPFVLVVEERWGLGMGEGT